MSYDIRDYGATGDGVIRNTPFIQAAIDACFQDGGGTVNVPAGRYLSGSIRLRTNVSLSLDPGAILIASIDPADIQADKEYVDSKTGYFIGAIDAENVSITGRGEIFGQGDLLMEKDDGVSEYPLLPGEFRSQLCYFRGCHNVQLNGITLVKSSEWTVHLIGCRHVAIQSVNILNNLRGANNDGIDPDACQDVRISGCHIEGGDDAIVIKTTRSAARMYGNCEDILISGCTLVSRGSAVKIGTETFGDIRNCVVTGCIVRKSNRGVGIWVRDGGTVENILVSDMMVETRMFRGAPHRDRVRDWWGKGEPLFISAACRRPGLFPGKIRRVLLKNIMAECENSVFLQGAPESPIEDVHMESLHLHFRMISGLEGGKYDIQPPENQVYDHENPAIYGSYVKGLTIKDSFVSWGVPQSKHWSNLLVCENSARLRVDGLTGRAACPGLPAVVLENIKGVRLDHSIASSDGTFLSRTNVEDSWADDEDGMGDGRKSENSR